MTDKEQGPHFGDYEIGYGRPPAATRFQPGRSGNPRGRPKGRKSNKSIAVALHEVLGRQIAEVPKDGRPIFAIEAIALGLTQSALHRNLQATKLLFELMADWSERDQALGGRALVHKT
jgi:hypothetical protein